jgi:uncharacterized repeat protein (TIGR01451 family)
VNATGAGAISNTAAVSGGGIDPNTGNNSSSVNTTITTSSVDLSVEKSGPTNLVTAGNNVSYLVRVRNNSATTPATSVQVTDTFSGIAANFVSATPGQGSCSGAGPITCNLGTIAPGAAVDITIVLQPTAAGTLTNQASVTGAETDPNTANNSDSVDTIVIVSPITISKIANPTTAIDGGSVVFTIEIENTTGVNVTVTSIEDDFGATPPANPVFEAVPGGCSSLPASGACVVGPVQPGFVTWTGSVVLAPGESMFLTINTVVNLFGAPAGQYCNPSYTVAYSIGGVPVTPQTITGSACVDIS